MRITTISSSENDPRQPLAAKPFLPLPISAGDLPIDYASFLATMLAFAGFALRYKAFSWVAIIFCGQSFANMKNFETDMKQTIMALTLAVSGLVLIYMEPFQSANRGR